MRIAAIADIHGNLTALDAVLADIAHRSVDQIVNLGDLLSGGVDPLGTADRLMPLRLPTVCGNHERQILSGQPGRSDWFARDAIGPHHRRWLQSLPATVEPAPGVLAFHGTPSSDTTYLLETVEELGVRPAFVGEVQTRLGTKFGGWDLMLCAHTHKQRAFRLPHGPLIVNPGSVGWPAYDDDVPVPHLMESGSPHARYAIVDNASGRWEADMVTLVYDWVGAASIAASNARPDVAQQLRTGFAVHALFTGVF